MENAPHGLGYMSNLGVARQNSAKYFFLLASAMIITQHDGADSTRTLPGGTQQTTSGLSNTQPSYLHQVERCWTVAITVKWVALKIGGYLEVGLGRDFERDETEIPPLVSWPPISMSHEISFVSRQKINWSLKSARSTWCVVDPSSPSTTNNAHQLIILLLIAPPFALAF
jgi:hypothetical protein